jgi:4-phospho-D-threonate 3-dehydrogenase / 4-phospho-D-erythronate 3-dehydrogenase
MPLVNNLHLPQAARADAVTVRQNTAVSRSPASALELQPQTEDDFTRKRIAVTMGDPAGIGPELCLRLLQDSEVTTRVTPIVFGDAGVLRRVARQCGLPEPERVVDPSQWQQSGRELRQPAVLDLQAIEASVVTPGHVDAATGLASYRYIEAALAAALAGTVDAVTTGPIHKEALHAAGFPYPGHTEIFAAGTGTTRSCMMLTSPEITCSLVTTHIGYRDVPDQLNTARILEVIELTAEAMRRIRNRPPRLTVCGLNPHAGEHGLFGTCEEERLIAPAVAAACRLGIDVRGPLPPDTAFVPQQRQTTDAFVCMYHDQGLIPLKALAFDTAVNVTLGLPIVRTSVDHGTALDIAWRGLAAASSLVQAVLLAARLANT